MCGRFTMIAKEEEIQNYYQIQFDLSAQQRYNIAPSQPILGITKDEEGIRKAKHFRWGLVPFWAKTISIGNRLINARAETIDEKPSFRHLIKRKRCLIACTGFFEWKKNGKQKQPYLIRLKNQPVFSLAGLWDVWKKDDQVVESCTIITTEANQLMEPIHHRMPVIFTPEEESAWIDEQITDTAYLKSMLTPFAEEEMELFAVSTIVNNPRNDLPETIQPMKQNNSGS